jgi:methionine biosynthesis protein MetW
MQSDVVGDCTVEGPAPEHEVILELIPRKCRALDLGCGDGRLLRALIDRKDVRAEGIEIAPECIQACVARGLINVHQGDLDQGLADYADQSMDYVILTGTIQVLQQPLALIREMARVGKHCIVGFPNFAYWSNRVQLGLLGRMPVTGRLPHEWYDTPNIHLTTIADFRRFCKVAELSIEREIPLHTEGRRCAEVRLWPSLLADYAIFVVTANRADQGGKPTA